MLQDDRTRNGVAVYDHSSQRPPALLIAFAGLLANKVFVFGFHATPENVMRLNNSLTRSTSAAQYLAT